METINHAYKYPPGCAMNWPPMGASARAIIYYLAQADAECCDFGGPA